MWAPVMSISPVEADSIVYSSVMADPAPIIDHPFVVESARSLTCGECPVPYPEPPDPIWVVNPFVVPFALGRFAVTHMSPVSVRDAESSM